MSLLLTGGSGKSSIRLARLCNEINQPYILASRSIISTSTHPAIKFDWTDESTFPAPFSASKTPISAMYIIAPEIADPVSPINKFIDYAITVHGVKRFVMMTGGAVKKGGVYTGGVWSHLDELKQSQGVEYTILLCTWFMENFSERQYVHSIKSEGKIYTACGDGKIPFITADDIAAVALRILLGTDPSGNKTEYDTVYRILGQRLMTYDEAAAIISKSLDRKIVHVKLSEEETVERYKTAGMPQYVAKQLAWLEVACKNGSEEMESDAIVQITGKEPVKFDDFVERERGVWQ